MAQIYSINKSANILRNNKPLLALSWRLLSTQNEEQSEFERDRFEFKIHDLVLKDEKAVLKDEKTYKKGIMH